MLALKIQAPPPIFRPSPFRAALRKSLTRLYLASPEVYSRISKELPSRLLIDIAELAPIGRGESKAVAVGERVLLEVLHGVQHSTYEVRANLFQVPEKAIDAVYTELERVFRSRGLSLSRLNATLIATATLPAEAFSDIYAAINDNGSLRVQWSGFAQ